MKICMFTNTYLPHIGGVARSVSTFAQVLRRNGHQVMIVAPTFPDQDSQEDEDVLRVPAIQNFNGSDFSVRIPLPSIVSDALEDFGPDIIHSHHPFLLGDTALRIARTLKLPLVFTHHTLYERYTHYVPLDSELLQRFVIRLAKEYANLCDQVIAPSSSVAKLLAERGVHSPIRVLPTGVDTEHFARGIGKRFRSRHAIPEQKKIIGHVGRLAAEKNLPFLARSIASALRKDEDIFCVITGRGDAEEEIQTVFQQEQCEDRIIMTGSLTGCDLADCYAAMDLFAFASTSETQGLVLAEAMAASTPVVALDASGVDDVLESDVNGVMLPADATEDEFGAALLSLLHDDSRRAAMARNSLATAQRFSHEVCADKLLQLYRQTISQNRPDYLSDIELLDEILSSIKVEWELLQQKASAALEAINDE